MDYFSSNEKVEENLIRLMLTAILFDKKRFLLSALIFLLFILQGFLNYAGAQVITEQDTVNINASVPGEDAGGGGGVPIIYDVILPEISDIKIDSITISSARVSWKTNELAVPQLNYGRTIDLEKTYIGESFTLENSIFLENLSPKTDYYFEIIAIDRGGNRSIAKDLRFTTLSLPDDIPPPNISRFKAAAGDSLVNLSWQNPADSDFVAVKIFRSDKFYPKYPGEGELVYNGNGNFHIDKSLINGTAYYYTAFAYDWNGNYSSGAVAKATPQKFVPPTPLPRWTPSPSVLPVTPLPQISPVPSEVTGLKLDDFIFTQDAKVIENIDGKIEAESGKSLIVSIDSKKVSEIVGTMMFILAQDGEPQSFLFKKDPKKNEYSVSFASPDIGGVYSFTIAVLNKKNEPVQAIGGSLSVNFFERAAEKSFWYIDLLWLFLIILIILVLRALWKILKKAREKEKREKEKKVN